MFEPKVTKLPSGPPIQRMEKQLPILGKFDIIQCGRTRLLGSVVSCLP
jgi:hypothetical protein